jgi:F-type H+-transporting ATPase subunit delta
VKNLAIARRYAKALLLIGKEDGQTDLYREELGKFADLIKTNDVLERAINNPLYDVESRKKVLQILSETFEHSRVMTSFLNLLFSKGRIKYIVSINDFFQKQADELKGIVRAKLVSAEDLPSETTEKIREALSQRTNKEVILEVEQDQSLIGGIVTKIGDLVLDGSIKTQLLNMRESLKRGESV